MHLEVADTLGENVFFSPEGGEDIVREDCSVAGEVQVIVRPPGAEAQEPPHPSAKTDVLTNLAFFLVAIATLLVSMYWYDVCKNLR